MPLTVEVRRLSEADDRFVEQWRELAASAVEPNPFFSPELLVPAGRRLPGGSEVRLLTVQRDHRLVLLVPVLAERHRRVPVAAVTTWRHPYRYVGTPLVRAGELDSAPAVALQGAREMSAWMVLEQVYVDGPVARAFRDATRSNGWRWLEQDVWERPAVRSREQFTYLEETLSPRSAKTLRRLRRNLERDVGPLVTEDLARSSGPGLSDEDLDAFLDMELAGWKGRAGTAMANDPAHAAFWRETSRAFTDSGHFELWRLRAGGVTAAQQCHLRMGDTVFHWKTAFNEDLAPYSPGVQLDLDVLEDFHVQPGLRVLDPCTDDVAGTSQRLYPDRRRIGEVLVGLTPTGRFLVRTVPAAVRTAKRIRALRSRVIESAARPNSRDGEGGGRSPS